MLETKEVQKDLVFDVGMHYGEDCDFYLKKGFKVIGFEADPDLVNFCRNRYSEEIQKGELIIVEGAISPKFSKESGIRTIKFYKNLDNTTWGTVVDEWADRNEYFGSNIKTIEVPIVDFSECIEKYGIPYYLKIDIEGMDIVCLKTLLNFDLKPSYVSIESEKISFGKLIMELNLLKHLGYVEFKAIQQKGISQQKEPNPSKEKTYLDYHFLEGSSGLFGEDLPYKWINYDQILNKYKWIFIRYYLFGDYGLLKRTIYSKIILYLFPKLKPGWYDTHAKHSSIVPQSKKDLSKE